MDPISSKVILGAASEPADPVYVDDFFSIRRYEGGVSTQIDIGGVQSYNNGFSLIKNLSLTKDWALKPFPRINTFTGWIRSNTGSRESGGGNGDPNFVSNGNLYLFDSSSGSGLVNQSGSEYCSWNFGSAPGFLDVVYYTGNGSTQTINHNLGSTPGAIFVKRLSNSGDDGNWAVHFSAMSSINNVLDLSSSDAVTSDNDCFDSSNSNWFKVGDDWQVNQLSVTYVAFVFASDDARFGTNRNQSIIKCGKISSGANAAVVLGFEPQFLLLKEDANNSSWELYDNIRGMTAEDIDDSVLHPDTNASQTTSENINVSSDGFKAKPSNNSLSNDIYYIAIRRPHKPVQSAAEVFSQTRFIGDTTTTSNAFSSGTRSVDTIIQSPTLSSTASTTYYQKAVFQRLTGDSFMWTKDDSYEVTASSTPEGVFDNQFGLNSRNLYGNDSGVFNFFSRAPGFYDVVTYSGQGTSGASHTRAIQHNLDAVPELMIVKRRNAQGANNEHWFMYTESIGVSEHLRLDEGFKTAAYTNPVFPVAPTANNFTVSYSIDRTSRTYVGMLFASLPGICKVGSYTASSSDQTIDCGFTNGARFVMLKDSSSTYGAAGGYTQFYVNTAAQGITTGDDYTDEWNNTVTDRAYNNVKPHSSGFIATKSGSSGGSSEIISGATVQFLAIA